MNQPEILNVIELLGRYKTQKSYSNAQLAANMTSFGWEWGETFVSDLFAGKSKATPGQAEHIKRYLLTRYYESELD